MKRSSALPDTLAKMLRLVPQAQRDRVRPARRGWRSSLTVRRSNAPHWPEPCARRRRSMGSLHHLSTERAPQRPGPQSDSWARQALCAAASRENPMWGAPRIHGELLKLGIEIGETCVGKYMVRRRKPPSQTWHCSWRTMSTDTHGSHLLHEVFAEDSISIRATDSMAQNPRGMLGSVVGQSIRRLDGQSR